RCDRTAARILDSRLPKRASPRPPHLLHSAVPALTILQTGLAQARLTKTELVATPRFGDDFGTLQASLISSGRSTFRSTHPAALLHRQVVFLPPFLEPRPWIRNMTESFSWPRRAKEDSIAPVQPRCQRRAPKSRGSGIQLQDSPPPLRDTLQ